MTPDPSQPPLGSHDAVDDPRNASVLINVNGALVLRPEAVVSVFDSGFVLGDGVWEGLRLHNGRLAFVDAHIDRLYAGAKALDIDIGLDRIALVQRCRETVRANGMVSGVHIRLMITRGVKKTPYQDPRVTIGGPTIVIIPEYKAPAPELASVGLTLFTVHVRRGAPDVQDPALNSHSKLNCILACIQAAKAGADEALMLDPDGFVATCNSTNFFIVRSGEVWTAPAEYLMPGITRATVIELCRANTIPAFEKRFALATAHGADEAFVTGTFGGVVPAVRIDGRTIGRGGRGPVTERLQALYAARIEAECPPGGAA